MTYKRRKAIPIKIIWLFTSPELKRSAQPIIKIHGGPKIREMASANNM
jgi:hypothetical protein